MLSSNLKAAGYVEQLRALQPGERLTLSVSANGSEWNGVTNMIGALYQLVDNGQVCSGLVNGAAPRTAVGLIATARSCSTRSMAARAAIPSARR